VSEVTVVETRRGNRRHGRWSEAGVDQRSRVEMNVGTVQTGYGEKTWGGDEKERRGSLCVRVTEEGK
jgi:hypothetical protein